MACGQRAELSLADLPHFFAGPFAGPFERDEREPRGRVGVRAQLDEACRLNAVRARLFEQEQDRIVADLGRAGIPAIPLKGVALARRIHGDITARSALLTAKGKAKLTLTSASGGSEQADVRALKTLFVSIGGKLTPDSAGAESAAALAALLRG